MPSAANVKIDKQVAPENALADASTPLRQVITLMGHKIRNLEKRKAKLESYKALQNEGKELNADQKTAVAKYDEVIQTLEFARDISKQFNSIANVSEKEAKKQAKKEAAAKNQAELARLREILLVQDALNQMGNDAVREDFLQGRNGAAQLTESDLKLLDDLYPAVTPKHEAGNPTAFTNEVQSAAEHLLAVVDGKSKEVFGGTYSQIKEVLGKIHESGYFDQQAQQVFESFAEGEPAEVVPVEGQLNHEAVPEVQSTIPVMEMLSIDPMPAQMLQHPVEQAPQALTPEQQIFYQQQQQQQQQQQATVPQQASRPIAEMLGTGTFFFLQDSEIDTPPEQIPSQTFTNQSFVGGPPPPIPLPPMFQNMPTNLQPQTIPGNNNDEETHKEDVQRPQNATGGNRGPKPNNNPNYYQNNNGYSNRPRQNRNGPRPINRH